MSVRFLKRSQLAAILKREKGIDVSDSCIERWLRKGVRGKVLPCRFVGGCRYILESDLNEFLENKNRPAYQCSPLGEMVQNYRAKEQREKSKQQRRQKGVEQAAENLKRLAIDTDQEIV